MNLDERDERCLALKVRGLDERLVHELRWCGNHALIIEAFNATDAEIAELNAAYEERHSSAKP